jgi:DnaJ like chaperone protein
VRAAWRRAVRAAHPDRLRARGLPPEAMKLAEARLAAVNAAWEEIGRRRAG